MSRIGSVNPAFIKHRDDQCAESVGQMAKLRRFEQEFIAYGTVEWQPNGEVQYISTTKPEKIFQYKEEKQKKGSIFLPLQSLSNRSLMPAGMEEILPMAAKHALLSKMKKDCEATDCVEKLSPFFAQSPNDEAYLLLEQYRHQVDGYYDATKLEIFHGLVGMAYEAKILSLEKYLDFLKWESGVIHEMEDNPIHGNAFHRTMYGFAFFTGNRTDCFCDANREFLLQKYEEKRELGLLVGPILSKTYYFAQLNQMKEVRKSFSAEVQNSAKEYVDLVKKIKSLPGVIEINKLQEIKKQFADNAYALRAVRFFETIWNPCKSL